MAEIIQEQLIGSMVPDVYIQKINLESSGTPLKEHNPHIQHPRENKPITSSAEKEMKISLDLCLKDKFDNGLIDTWFSQQDFKKYLKVTIVQSSDPLATALLSASNNAIRLATANDWVEKLLLLSQLIETVKDLPEFAKKNLTTELAAVYLNDISENVTVQSVSLHDITAKDNLLTDYHYTQGETGGAVYDITYRTTFSIPTADPQHLSYLAVTSVDLDMLSNDFDLYIDDPYMADMMQGKVAMDTVIENGELVSKAFIFQDADGNVWTGPVFEGANGFLAGTSTSAESFPVKKTVVTNSKVQDYRIFDRIEKVQHNMDSVENILFSKLGGLGQLKQADLIPTATSNYFTDVGMTMDPSHNSKFVFGFDYGKIIRDNVRFGSLYGPYNQAQLFDNVKIRNLKIKRRRVTANRRTLNKLGSPTYQRDVFDSGNDIPIIIARGHEKNNEFTSIPSTMGNISEVDLASAGTLQTRHFMCSDATMASTTDGMYQYGIELEVEDNSYRLIWDKIKKLSRARADMDAYYERASLAVNDRGEGSFDVMANRFTKSFIEWSHRTYPSFLSYPTNRALLLYCNLFSTLAKTSMDLEVITDILKMCAPESGSPRGIDLLRKLVDNLISRAVQITGGKMEINSQRNGITNSLMPKAPPVKLFTVEHYFDKSYNSNFPKGVGYDYLSNGPTQKTATAKGLRRISLSDYTARTDSETLKYFNSKTADVKIASNGTVFNPEDTIDHRKLTFLSPSNVILGKLGGTCLLTNPFDVEENNKVQSTILSLNMNKKSPFIPLLLNPPTKNRQSAATSLAMKMAKFNFSNNMALFNVTQTQVISSKLLSPIPLLDMSYDPYTDASDMLGFEWDNVDPVDYERRESDQDDETEAPEDPTIFFAYLLKPVVLLGVGTTGFFNDSAPIPEPPAQEIQNIFSFYSSNFYNITNGTNAIQKVLKKVNTLPLGPDDKLPTAMAGGQTPTLPIVQKKVFALPNQIKSLFMSSISPTAVKHNWTMPEGDLLKMPLNVCTFALNYKMMRKTQALVGYKRGADGNALLKNPIWRDLDRDLLSAMSGKNLLCRLVKYENREFGIVEPKGLRMPVYDKFFIMSVPSASPAPALPNMANIFNVKLAKKIKMVSGQLQSVAPQYLATATVKPLTLKVSPNIKAKMSKKV